MIPQEKSAAVARAVREAFGVEEFEDVRPLNHLGVTSAVFRIAVRGCPYLLRIVTRAFDNSRHYANMRIAAEGGLAPKVWYADNEDLVSITDFVERAPFPMSEALSRIPEMLRTMHALPPFAEVPKEFNTSCTFLVREGPALDGFLTRVRASMVLSATEEEEVFAAHAKAVDVYRRLAPDVVSCHNDLKPENVVFDGRHVWAVDWEAAGLNDRYSDLAVFANFVTTSEEEERDYLTTYFGRPPSEYESARFFVMRQISHMFYALGFPFLGSLRGGVVPEGPGPDFVEYHRRIWDGGVDVKDAQTKMVYGRVHLERLLGNTRSARFAGALAILA
jgi:aminoglycoside phosphotransferase (APT) family kinase protein